VKRIDLKWADTVPEQTRTAVIEALERFPANALETYQTHRRSTVGRVSIGGCWFVIKRYNVPKPSTRLRLVLGVSPAGRAWKNAAVARQIGIATPLVVGIATVGPWGHLQPGAYLVTEYLQAQTIDMFLESAQMSVERKRTVADRVLQAVQRLHAHGYVHGDLKAKNILVSNDVPYFIDLDTVGRPLLRCNRRRGMAQDYERLFLTNPLLLDYADWIPDRSL